MVHYGNPFASKYYAFRDEQLRLRRHSHVDLIPKDGYIAASCNDATALGVGSGNTPLIVGEWSLAVNDTVASTAAWAPSTQKAFYTKVLSLSLKSNKMHIWWLTEILKWFAAQVQAYENQLGWVFWTWKSQLGTDYRWSYVASVAAGVIPTDLDTIAGLDVC
jgi:hypothetical protein